MSDRFEVVEAMARAADELGWRLESADTHEWLVRVSVVPPLARSDARRNRWPHEPEENQEPTTGPDDIPGLVLPLDAEPITQRRRISGGESDRA